MLPTVGWLAVGALTERSTGLEGRASWPRPVKNILKGALPATLQYVIHTVGPVWSGGQRSEEEKLASAYQSSLELAVENGCGSVAFPSLSTGAYRYPVDLAAGTALNSVLSFLQKNHEPKVVRFVLFDDPTHAAYVAALRKITTSSGPQESSC